MNSESEALTEKKIEQEQRKLGIGNEPEILQNREREREKILEREREERGGDKVERRKEGVVDEEKLHVVQLLFANDTLTRFHALTYLVNFTRALFFSFLFLNYQYLKFATLQLI